jgi:hypothetical protein
VIEDRLRSAKYVGPILRCGKARAEVKIVSSHFCEMHCSMVCSRRRDEVRGQRRGSIQSSSRSCEYTEGNEASRVEPKRTGGHAFPLALAIEALTPASLIDLRTLHGFVQSGLTGKLITECSSLGARQC